MGKLTDEINITYIFIFVSDFFQAWSHLRVFT